MPCVGVLLDIESAEDDCYNLFLASKEEGATDSTSRRF